MKTFQDKDDYCQAQLGVLVSLCRIMLGGAGAGGEGAGAGTGAGAVAVAGEGAGVGAEVGGALLGNGWR